MVNQLTGLPVIRLNRQTGKQANRQTNNNLFNEAKKYIPGGVNSPARSFKAVGGGPIFIKKGKGSKIYGEDGHEFIDYCLSWGALILGHADKRIESEIKKALGKGSAFGAPTKCETELAKNITEAIPSMEKVRLTNSGTEAVMAAVRIARAFTRRSKLVKFEGSYHGHADYLLDCRGIPGAFRDSVIAAPYNDEKMVEEIVKEKYGDIAAIIVEPVAANMGVIPPREGFLQNLRRLCDARNIVLIFDEVITGFRLIYGGAQKYFGVRPDLTCLGKIIGGGLPVGAFGGRADLMKLISPEGDVYQAGTFSGNPLTTAAGITTLKALKKEGLYQDLSKKTAFLCRAIADSAQKYGLNLRVNSVGSIFGIFFSDAEVMDYPAAKRADMELFKRFYHLLLKNGVYLSPSGHEANFVSTAHSAKDLKTTLRSINAVFSDLRRE
jgi:glutamate-1-semialdehyde 2,1-aminomutase